MGQLRLLPQRRVLPRPFEIVDKDVPFILLMNDGKTRPVDARALTFLHRSML